MVLVVGLTLEQHLHPPSREVSAGPLMAAEAQPEAECQRVRRLAGEDAGAWRPTRLLLYRDGERASRHLLVDMQWQVLRARVHPGAHRQLATVFARVAIEFPGPLRMRVDLGHGVAWCELERQLSARSRPLLLGTISLAQPANGLRRRQSTWRCGVREHDGRRLGGAEQQSHWSRTGRPRIGLLWGDFPWEQPAPRIRKLISMGATARTTSQALRAVGQLVPFVPPDVGASPEARRQLLANWLSSIDVLWADVYAVSEPALQVRYELDIPCPAVLFAGGAVPKALDTMLFPWQHLLRPGDGLWLTCESDRAIWRGLVRRSALHEWVIPIAVDETTFHPGGRDEQAMARIRHGVAPGVPLLLSVGRLNVQKNLHALLFLLTAVRRAVRDTHLCFVGEEDDIVLGEFGVRNTGYVAWLRGVAAEMGMEEAISFVGASFGEELAQLYRAADVVVSASFYHRENFGLSQAEAQACGVPVVCTAWGGFKEVVRDKETGFLMDAVLTKHGVRVDWATGADRVVSLLQDHALRNRMGANAAAMAREQFTIKALTRAFTQVVIEVGQARGDAESAARRAVPRPEKEASVQAAYEPSRFARRYEAHKRASGWYADPSEPPRWYPPLFGGRDYKLYERIMAPYATRLAESLALRSIRGEWIPYFPSAVVLDDVRQVVEDRDPVWPHRRSCQPEEWAVARRVDGATTVEAITAEVMAECPSTYAQRVLAIIRHLYIEGFVLFRQTVTTLVADAAS